MQSYLSCNVCKAGSEGIAYRTNCYHLVCPSCTQQAFASGCRCPVCSAQTEIQEVIVGMAPSVEPLDCMLQLILQNQSWDKAIMHFRTLQLNLMELSTFIQTQLSVGSKSLYETAITQESLLKKLQSDLEEMQIRGEEHQRYCNQQCDTLASKLHEAEKQIAHLYESCKEKQRKCQAWEKAYGSLRDQLLQGASHVSPALSQQPIVDGSPLSRTANTAESLTDGCFKSFNHRVRKGECTVNADPAPQQRTLRKRTEVSSVSVRPFIPSEWPTAPSPTGFQNNSNASLENRTNEGSKTFCATNRWHDKAVVSRPERDSSSKGKTAVQPKFSRHWKQSGVVAISSRAELSRSGFFDQN